MKYKSFGQFHLIRIPKCSSFLINPSVIPPILNMHSAQNAQLCYINNIVTLSYIFSTYVWLYLVVQN